MNEIRTEMVSVATPDGPMTAHLARPADDAPRPGVVVGFEMFGLTPYATSIGDKLARAGYVALVPDFFHRHAGADGPVVLPADADGRDRGVKLVDGLRRDEVTADVAACLDLLARHDAVAGRPGLLGVSAGGHILWYAATQLPVGAVAAFYPGWLTTADFALSRPEPLLERTGRIAALGTPTLVLLGEGDHLYTADDRAAIAAALTAAGGDMEYVGYADTPHGFFCDERPTFRPDQAADAWDRTLRLFARTLAVG